MLSIHASQIISYLHPIIEFDKVLGIRNSELGIPVTKWHAISYNFGFHSTVLA